jgi:protein-tyrosine-phosphatase
MKILFVCEHGAAKSVIAAAYLNRIAEEKGLILQAAAFGTIPNEVFAPAAVGGLLKDGITLEESKPRKITRTEIESAQMVVSFCNLPAADYGNSGNIQYWQGVPPVSADYETARNAILERLYVLIKEIR